MSQYVHFYFFIELYELYDIDTKHALPVHLREEFCIFQNLHSEYHSISSEQLI